VNICNQIDRQSISNFPEIDKLKEKKIASNEVGNKP
jgi:hypothetical protein